MEKQKYLKKLIIAKLKEDYAIAVDKNLEYCYESYENLIKK